MLYFDVGRDRIACQYRPMNPEAHLLLRIREIERNPDMVKAMRQHYAKGRGYISLHAHVIPNSEWTFATGYGDRLVQDFINEYDGKYRMLIIDVNNYGAWTVHSRKSFVIHAQDDSKSFERGMRMHIPHHGYLEEQLRKAG